MREQALEHVLGLLVARMRLAGEHDLDRPVAAEQREHPVGVLGQQPEPLVGGDAPREADREHVGVEGALGGRDVLAQVDARRAGRATLRSRT